MHAGTAKPLPLPPPGPSRPCPSVPLLCWGPLPPLLHVTPPREPATRQSCRATPDFVECGVLCMCAMIDSRTLFSYFVSTSHTTSDDSRWGDRTTLCQLGADGCFLLDAPPPPKKKHKGKDNPQISCNSSLFETKQNKTNVVRKNVGSGTNDSLLCCCSLSRRACFPGGGLLNVSSQAPEGLYN